MRPSRKAYIITLLQKTSFKVNINACTRIQAHINKNRIVIVRDLPEYTSSVSFPGQSFRPHRTKVPPAVDYVKPIR